MRGQTMRKAAIFLTVCMLLSLCACTVRKTESAVGTEQTGNPATAGAARPSASTAQSAAEPARTPDPASGTDLEIPEPLSDAASKSLAQARQLILDADAVFGLAFIGHTDPNMSIPEAIAAWEALEERGYAECYPFMKEMTPRQCTVGGGSGLYCLLPLSEGDLVVIEQAEILAGKPVEPYTEIYRSSSGESVFFTAGSDGKSGSDVIVTVKDGKGRELRCDPAMWSDLTMPVQTEGVADLTIYPGNVPQTGTN